MPDKEINKVYTSEQPETSAPDINRGMVLFNPQRYIYEGEHTKEEGDYWFVAGNKLASYKMVHGTDKTLWRQLERFMQTLPNGPYYMDSRDDGITIHNANFNQAPMATYIYAGGNGEFLSMSVKTNKNKKNLQATKSSTIDPKTKSLTTTISQSLTDESSMPTSISRAIYGDDEPLDKFNWSIQQRLSGGDSSISYEDYLEQERQSKIDAVKDIRSTKREVIANYQVTPDDVKRYLEQERQNFETQLSNAQTNGDIEPLLGINSMGKFLVKRKVPVRITVNPADYGGEPGPNTHHGKYSQSDASRYARRYSRGIESLKDSPGIIYVGPTMGEKKAKEIALSSNSTFYPTVDIIVEKEIEFELDGARVFSAVTPQDLQDAWASNVLGDNITKQLDATLRVIGNPSLRSSKVIDIRNISDRYSGKWYTKKVRHIINSGQGYVCECELIRKGLPVSIAATQSSVDMNKLYNELHGVAKETLSNKYANRKAYNNLKQTFKDWYTDDQGRIIKRNSEVVSVDEYNETGEVVIRPATQDQINIFEEREAARDIQER